MPTYVQKGLKHFQHPHPSCPQHCPFEPAPKTYGKASQDTTPTENSELLDQKGINWIQQVVGYFLYYAGGIDITILTALNVIAGDIAAPTQNSPQQVSQFLD